MQGQPGNAILQDNDRDTAARISAAFQKGCALQKKDRLEEAARAYREVLHLDPDHISSLNNLATALRKLGHHGTAAAYSRRVSELAPLNYHYLSNYGNALLSLDRKSEALTVHAEAVIRSPGDFIIRKNYAIALREFGKHDEALFHFNVANTMKPGDPDIQWELAGLYLRTGRFEEGWKAFEVRWQFDWMKSPHHDHPRWTGESFRDKTIMLCAEQGFGDTILCSRYIPMLKMRGGRIIFICKKNLHRLFKTVPGIDSMIEPGVVTDPFDCHISIMSLPGIFGTTLNSIPPLPDLYVPEKTPPEAQRLLDLGKGKFRVGIVWSGSTTFKSNHKRAVSFKRFLPFAEIPGVQLYSLQKGPCEKELADAGAQGLVLELGPHMDDFADTASILKQLDLVIMTDSSVAHLAGSLGCPVWNLLPYHAYWLYLSDRDDSPWYPSMTFIRQTEPGDWDGVFERALAKLQNTVSGRKRENIAVRM